MKSCTIYFEETLAHHNTAIRPQRRSFIFFLNLLRKRHVSHAQQKCEGAEIIQLVPSPIFCLVDCLFKFVSCFCLETALLFTRVSYLLVRQTLNHILIVVRACRASYRTLLYDCLLHESGTPEVIPSSPFFEPFCSVQTNLANHEE